MEDYSSKDNSSNGVKIQVSKFKEFLSDMVWLLIAFKFNYTMEKMSIHDLILLDREVFTHNGLFLVISLSLKWSSHQEF